MSNTQNRFYITGGTLPTEARSYIPRRADTELLESLLQGEFCSVLSSRQMGKSSLMVRTAARLRESGVSVAVGDLTALGQDLTAAQWYDSLLALIGEQLGLETEIDEYCEANQHLSPLQRWRGAIRETTLKWLKTQIVIFIDEIDITKSLPFSTDEFFAAIRELYNSRVREPELNRLTFCLLGVAAPSDLIRDTRTTPFNIGRQIELTDFTADEAAPLAEGLASDHPPAPRKRGVHWSGIPFGENWHWLPRTGTEGGLLSRILYWTGGHPYLTQRLCQSLAEALSSPTPYTLHPTPSLVDRLCAEMYFGEDSENRDDNLAFVRNRLLNNQEVEQTGLLLLYGQVLNKERVPADEKNAMVSVLRLAGLVRREGGLLHPRNRIYERVFDLKWVRAHLPGVEIRRQEAAFQRGVLRASGVFALIALIVGALIFVAFRQSQRADFYAKKEAILRYVSDMNVAQQAWDEGGSGQALELLESHRPKRGELDLRDFEWHYLWAQSHQAKAVYPAHQGIIFALAVSPDGSLLASGGQDGNIKLWNTTTQKIVGTLTGHTNYVLCVVFSPDGKTLVSSGEDGSVYLWNVTNRKKIGILSGYTSQVFAAVFSSNGRMLAVADDDGLLCIWNTATMKKIKSIPLKGGIKAVSFSPDNRLLAVGGDGQVSSLWDTTKWKQVGHNLSGSDKVYSIAFSHKRRLLAEGYVNGKIILWDVASQRKVATSSKHTAVVNSIAFSRDDKTLVSASWDDTIKLWDIPSLNSIATIKGHTDRVTAAVFFKGDTMLASSSSDGTIRLWDMTQSRRSPFWNVAPNEYSIAAFSPDSRMLATGEKDGTISLWDVTSQKKTASLAGHGGYVFSVAFSPDGKLLASSSKDRTLRLWDMTTLREIRSFPGMEGAEQLVWSRNGAFLAAMVRSGNTVRLWKTADWREIGSPFFYSKERIVCLAFSPDNKTVAFSDDSSRNRIKLLDVVTNQLTEVLQGHSGTIRGLSFSPDGTLLASCSFDRTIRLLDVSTRKEIHILRGHRGSIGVIAFSPDGKTLASGSDDKTVRLWNIETHREVAVLKGHTGKIQSVEFSPDGNTLASADDTGMIRLWRASPLSTLK